MRSAIALYQVMNPDSVGSYHELICSDPLPDDVPAEVWRRSLRDWALVRLERGVQHFGMYRVAIEPADDNAQPDKRQIIEQDDEPVEEYVIWSGACELVEA